MQYQMKDYPAQKGYIPEFYEIIDFLKKKNEEGSFLSFHWSRFEWMFARDGFNADDLSHIKRIYQDNMLVGLCLFEDQPTHYFLIYNDQSTLKVYIKNYLQSMDYQGDLILPQDDEMIYLMKQIGYKATDDIDQLSKFTLKDIELPKPEGYDIVTLASDPNMREVQYALWRGFNHGDDVPYRKEDLISRDHMFSSPHFNRHYAYVAKTEEHFVCFVGIWYMPGTKVASLEPVATVPDHRQKGLAKACIYHAIKAVKDAGATEIYVGSDQISYQKIGFVPYDHLTRYTKK